MLTITLRYYDSDNHFNYTDSAFQMFSKRTLLFRHSRFSSMGMGGWRIIQCFVLLHPFIRACSFPPTARFKFGLCWAGKTLSARFRSRNQKTRERAVPSEAGVGVPSLCKIHVARRDAAREAETRSLTQPNVGRTLKAVPYSRAFNLGARLSSRRVT